MEEGERRFDIDPRYVTTREWSQWRDDVRVRFTDVTREHELFRAQVAEELTALRGDVKELRIETQSLRDRIGSLTGRIIGAVAVIGLIGGPVVTYFLNRHG